MGTIKKHFIIVLIVVLGFFLRIYQIGNDSFWLDETGVASVIFADSMVNFINVVRSHVAAVPLDYVITWIIGQFTLSEGWLRLPSAIWGTLTLVISYSLFSTLTNKKIAIIGLLLLTISPLHIKYSQELRFYSSLIFFYIFSTKLLLVAFSSNKTSDWVKFTLITIIGGYFHIYVGLTVVNGLLLFFFSGRMYDIKNIRKFLISLIFIILGALIAFYFFAGYNSLLAESFTKFETLIQALGVGFGWIPVTQDNNWLIFVWGFTCFLLEVYGIVIIWRYDRYSSLSILLFSIGIQIGAILFLTMIRGYFIQSRHFIFLYPMVLLICAKGFSTIIDRMTLKELNLSKNSHSIISVLLICSLCATSLPALLSYYQGNKGYAREIAFFLIENWKPGDSIFFFPYPYSAEPFKYYLIDVQGNDHMLPYMWTVDINKDIDTILNWGNGNIYLIGSTSPEQELFLSQKGFMTTELQNVWLR